MPYNRTHCYVASVSVGAILAGIGVYLLSPAVSNADIMAALFMSGMGILAHFMLYKLPRGGHGSVAFVPFLAAALIAPKWISVVAVVALVIVVEGVLRRRQVIKALFNVAQASLALSLGIAAFLLLGGRSLPELIHTPLLVASVSNFLPTITLIIVFFATNSLLVSGAIALSSDVSLLHIWKKNTLATAPYDVLASPVVYLLGWIYVTAGALGATALCIPLLGVRQLYKTNSQLEQVNRELLELMVKAIEARDPYTSGHSRRVAHYSKIIARGIGLSANEIERVGVAALLHDVGKIHEVYAPILRKPDKLTPDEWAIMQTHPIKSAELVSTVSQLQDIVAAVRHHHENWDGSGYPDGLAGEDIPLAARVVLFADTIDAMTTDRPYRKALGEAQVRAELTKFRGRQFDPSICDKLLASPMFGLLFVPGAHERTPIDSRRVSRPAREAVTA